MNLYNTTARCLRGSGALFSKGVDAYAIYTAALLVGCDIPDRGKTAGDSIKIVENNLIAS